MKKKEILARLKVLSIEATVSPLNDIRVYSQIYMNLIKSIKALIEEIEKEQEPVQIEAVGGYKVIQRDTDGKVVEKDFIKTGLIYDGERGDLIGLDYEVIYDELEKVKAKKYYNLVYNDDGSLKK